MDLWHSNFSIPTKIFFGVISSRLDAMNLQLCSRGIKNEEA
jgi:hypothetical protein